MTALESNQSIIQVPGWADLPWLRHGFSTRNGGVSTVYLPDDQDGDLNLGWTKEDTPANIAENRNRLTAAVLGSGHQASLITLRQVHSATTLVVGKGSSESFTTPEGRASFEADGLITNSPHILLGIQTADCVPVLVVDTAERAVAAFHAGWRGTAARIVEQGIAQMISEYGSRPEDLRAAIGPSIGACCYTVGDEVHTAFTTNFPYGEDLFRTDASGLHLDLWEANRRQLLGTGLAPSQITIIAECTGCTGLPGRRRYFSHRCEHGFTGRMMSVIGIIEAQSPEI